MKILVRPASTAWKIRLDVVSEVNQSQIKPHYHRHKTREPKLQQRIDELWFAASRTRYAIFTIPPVTPFASPLHNGPLKPALHCVPTEETSVFADCSCVPVIISYVTLPLHACAGLQGNNIGTSRNLALSEIEHRCVPPHARYVPTGRADHGGTTICARCPDRTRVTFFADRLASPPRKSTAFAAHALLRTDRRNDPANVTHTVTGHSRLRSANRTDIPNSYSCIIPHCQRYIPRHMNGCVATNRAQIVRPHTIHCIHVLPGRSGYVHSPTASRHSHVVGHAS